MPRVAVIFLFLLVVFGNSRAASSRPIVDKEAGTIALTEPMSAALHAYNPRFKPWSRGDYAPTVLKCFAKENSPYLPFAVICDVNKDGAVDLVLDGHDGVKSLLLGIVSGSKGYGAVLIEEAGPEADPAAMECVFEGKREKGFATYLWPVNDDRATPDRVEVFWRMIPQQSKANGELLNDGGFLEYSYKDGRFLRSGETIA